MIIALYDIMEDIRAWESQILGSVPIHTRKLVLNRITHILCSYQVITSFNQFMFRLKFLFNLKPKLCRVLT